jgi:hypothetical protein
MDRRCRMRRVISVIVAVLVLSVAAVGAAPSQGKGKKQSGQEKSKQNSADSSVAINVVFASTDVIVLKDYYAPRYRNLPPGLQKKVARGGQLPPGWQKKFEPFPVEVERRLPPLPDGCRRGVIDGHGVIFNTRTNVIIDVAVLF